MENKPFACLNMDNLETVGEVGHGLTLGADSC